MQSLEALYGEVDNLHGFRHPMLGQQLHFLSDTNLICLADELTEAIVRSGCQHVVVAETGASPFAEICETIAAHKGSHLNWQRAKFPRDPVGNIFPVLNHFLTQEERKANLSPIQLSVLSALSPEAPEELQFTENDTRIEALKRICQQMPPDFFAVGPASVPDLLAGIGTAKQSDFQSAVFAVLQGTELAHRFSEPFIYFDEYIDSGTTLRNALSFFRCFTDRLQCRTASYFINLVDTDRKQAVLHTLFNSASRAEGYLLGAYPFENRVDLIGHYYRITDQEYVRVEVASIASALAEIPDCSGAGLIERLETAILDNALLEDVKNRTQLPDVRRYVQVAHVLRHCLWWLEKKAGLPDYAEFLFQLFDMYGPCWSPLPVDYHFDFWRGFEATGQLFESLQEFPVLLDEYLYKRLSILKQVADLCLNRRQNWHAQIHKQLEELYGNGRSYSSRQLAYSLCQR